MDVDCAASLVYLSAINFDEIVEQVMRIVRPGAAGMILHAKYFFAAMTEPSSVWSFRLTWVISTSSGPANLIDREAVIVR